MRNVKRSDSNIRLLVGVLIAIVGLLSLMFDVAKEFEPPLNYVLYGIVFIIAFIISIEFVDEEILN